MVDVANLPEASNLKDEFQRIGAALDSLDADGRIMAISIATEGGHAVSIPTGTMEYPAEVVTGIKATLVARQDEIAQQLADIGVSGVETPQR